MINMKLFTFTLLDPYLLYYTVPLYLVIPVFNFFN